MCVLISYGYLKIIGNDDLTIMYQTIFGGKPLNGIMLKGLFIMTFFLLQYIHIDYVVFFIDNSDHLSIRYGSRNAWIKALLRGTFIITLFFVLLFYSLWLILDLVFNNSNFSEVLTITTIGVIGRVYLFSIITILLQISLLLKMTKTNTYMIMGSVSVFLTMISQYNSILLNFLPQFENSLNTFLNVSVNVLFALLLISNIKRISRKRELLSYEN